jgi:hypothetical protein
MRRFGLLLVASVAATFIGIPASAQIDSVAPADYPGERAVSRP